MPKTSTGNKRAGSASTKKSGLKRRFDLTNRKVQFFVVIAIVAVLGGGYLTVKSFANTVVATWPANTLGPAWHQGKHCSISEGTDSQKNSQRVWNFSCVDGAGEIFQIPGNDTQPLQAGTYQVCVNAKGAGALKVRLIADGGIKNEREFTLVNDGSYREYCSYNLPISSGTRITPAIYVRGNPSALVKLLNVQLKQVPVTSPIPAPAPAPSK